MMKILLEIIQLIKRIFNLPKNYMMVQNENAILKRDLFEENKYIERLELLVQNIGYNLSQSAFFLENKDKDEKANDILKFQKLANGLRESIRCRDFLEFEKKISNAEFFENALFELLKNNSVKDDVLIERAIRHLTTRGFMK
jgi:hypothetical protein